jgi:hypothetical protein
MGSQLEGRASVDAQTRPTGYDTRDIRQHENNGSRGQYTASGGADLENVGQRQRILGPVPEDGKVPDGSLPVPDVNGRGSRDQEGPRDLPIMEKPRTNSSLEGRKTQRVCKKCGELLTGQFVRALEGTFHLDCFRCKVRWCAHEAFAVR